MDASNSIAIIAEGPGGRSGSTTGPGGGGPATPMVWVGDTAIPTTAMTWVRPEGVTPTTVGYGGPGPGGGTGGADSKRITFATVPKRRKARKGSAGRHLTVIPHDDPTIEHTFHATKGHRFVRVPREDNAMMVAIHNAAAGVKPAPKSAPMVIEGLAPSGAYSLDNATFSAEGE